MIQRCEVVKKAYPSGFFYIPEDLHKTRRFYEFIVVNTKSVEITHIPSRDDLSKITFLKLKIFKVINPTYWNQDPYMEKTFSKPFVPHSFWYKRLSDDMVQCHLVSQLRALVVYSILKECSQNSLPILVHEMVENLWICQRYIFHSNTEIVPLLRPKYLQNSISISNALLRIFSNSLDPNL